MSFIPKITCRRCRRQYSGIRGRCPHCGAKKVKQSERTPDTTGAAVRDTPQSARTKENERMQLIVGVVLLAVIIIAVIILISVSLKDRDPDLPEASPSPSPSAAVTPSPSPTPTATPEPTIAVTSITITFLGAENTGFTMKTSDAPLQFGTIVYPLDVDVEVTWSSTNEAAFTVSQTGLVTAVAAGNGSLVASCGGMEKSIPVTIKAG